MNEEQLEDLLGHYLDNVESAVDVTMGHLDNQENLSDEDRQGAIDLIKERINDAM